jgi:hypothetical protein
VYSLSIPVLIHVRTSIRSRLRYRFCLDRNEQNHLWWGRQDLVQSNHGNIWTERIRNLILNSSDDLESFTTSKMDRHLLRQKFRQKISIIKTNTFDDIKKIVHFGILIHVLS